MSNCQQKCFLIVFNWKIQPFSSVESRFLQLQTSPPYHGLCLYPGVERGDALQDPLSSLIHHLRLSSSPPSSSSSCSLLPVRGTEICSPSSARTRKFSWSAFLLVVSSVVRRLCGVLSQTGGSQAQYGLNFFQGISSGSIHCQ